MVALSLSYQGLEMEKHWPFSALLPGAEGIVDEFEWLKPDFVTEEGRMKLFKTQIKSTKKDQKKAMKQSLVSVDAAAQEQDI